EEGREQDRGERRPATPEQISRDGGDDERQQERAPAPVAVELLLLRGEALHLDLHQLSSCRHARFLNQPLLRSRAWTDLSISRIIAAWTLRTVSSTSRSSRRCSSPTAGSPTRSAAISTASWTRSGCRRPTGATRSRR